MASVPEITHSGETWSSLVAAGLFPQELRKHGVDEATKLTYLTRKWNTFQWLLSQQFKAARRTKNDRMFKTFEINELDRYYTVSVASGQASGDSGVERVIGVPDTQAAQIQVDDILFLKGIYATVIGVPLVAGQVYAGFASASGGAGTNNIGPDLGWATGLNPTSIVFSRTKGPANTGTYFCEEEQVKVIGKGTKGSAGTGSTWITLKRCYFGPSAYDEGGRMVPDSIVSSAITANTSAGAECRIQVGDVLLRGTPAFREGTSFPSGVYKNPYSDSNFTQEFKYAVERTEESEIPALWIKERPFDINKWITTIRMNRDKEYAYLLGRKGRDTDPDGREIYIMGGVREFIPKDKDHYFIYPGAQISYSGMLDLSKPILDLNNSGELWGVTGVSMDIALRKSFWNEHLWYNKEESKNFYMEVKTLTLAGVKINLIVSQVFEEAGFGNEIMLLDMSNGDSFVPVTHEDWDMKVKTNIQARDSSTYKEGIVGMFGLERRRKSQHAIIDFSNAVNL